MSKHLFGLIATPYGTAANNRGDNEGGNITPLQKLLWKDEEYTTVSAEAIRWALRYHWQQIDETSVNRVWHENKSNHIWTDKGWKGWNPDAAGGIVYIDDDVLGFMDALAASRENDAAYTIPQRQRELREAVEEAEEDADSKKVGQAKKKQTDFGSNLSNLEKKWQELSALLEGNDDKTKEKIKTLEREIKNLRKSMGLKGVTLNRRGALEVTRAISLSPFAGDITFNAKSGDKTNTSLYGTEVHATRYQYGIALTPKSLHTPARVLDVVDAIINLKDVGGNHSRFLFDFSPDSFVFRWTDDFAPRMLYSFEMNSEGNLSFTEDFLKKVENGDIDAGELFVGGSIVDTLDERGTTALGLTQADHEKSEGDADDNEPPSDKSARKAFVHRGIKLVVKELNKRIRTDLDMS